MKAERKTEPHSAWGITANFAPASGRSHTEHNGGDSAAEKPQDTETRDKCAKVLRPPPSCVPHSETWIPWQSENWTVVPLPQMLLEKCPLVFQRGWAGQVALMVHGILGRKRECGGWRKGRKPPQEQCMLGLHPFRISKNQRAGSSRYRFRSATCSWQKPVGNGEMD